MNITIYSFCPEAYPSVLGVSVMKRAMEKGIWSLSVKNIKDFGMGKHRQVDDTPYGGGAGMVLRPETVEKIFEDSDINNKKSKFIYFTPRGKLFDQQYAHELSRLDEIYMLAGRFEGVDQRALDYYGIEEVSIGDYVLAAGDLAAMVVTEAVIRLLPDALGSNEAIKEESFSCNSEYANLLEYPQYTKPQKWKEIEVPNELLSGNHKLIENWRFERAQIDTRSKRPDLWKKFQHKLET